MRDGFGQLHESPPPMIAEASITESRAAEFRKLLQSKIVVADGAMGTMLYGKGIFINRCFGKAYESINWKG